MNTFIADKTIENGGKIEGQFVEPFSMSRRRSLSNVDLSQRDRKKIEMVFEKRPERLGSANHEGEELKKLRRSSSVFHMPKFLKPRNLKKQHTISENDQKAWAIQDNISLTNSRNTSQNEPVLNVQSDTVPAVTFSHVEPTTESSGKFNLFAVIYS